MLPEHRRAMCVMCIFSCAAVIGYLNINTTRLQKNFSEQLSDGSTCFVSGVVYDIREGTSGYQVFLKASEIGIYKAASDKNSVLDASVFSASYTGKTKLILYVEDVSDIIIGRKIAVDADMSRPSSATNPGAFDAKSYYANKGIYLIGKNVVYRDKERGRITLGHVLYNVRTTASKVVEGAFSREDASVVQAMLLGEKSGLDKDTKRLFQINGIAHILAISGVHIAIIGMSLFKLLRRILGSYVSSGILAISVVIMYGIMTGLASSTFRAVIMMIISVVGKMRGRSSDMLTSAGVALVIQALVDPYIILDAGFRLSFGAVAGMGIYGPLIRQIMVRGGSLADTVAVNIAVTFATTPLVVYYFYQFPAYSIMLNIVIVPLVSFILFLSIGVIAVGMFHMGAACMAAKPVEMILGFYRWACRVMAAVPGSNVNVGHISPAMMAVFYICVYVVLKILSDCAVSMRRLRADADEEQSGANRRPEQFRETLMLCAGKLFVAACLAVSCMIFEEVSLDRDSKVVFIDVGQGDGILIHTNMGTNVLIDGGSSDKKQVGEYVIAPVLKYYGAAHLDYVFVTHGDNDHISGIKYLLETSDTGVVIDNLVLPRFGSQEELEEIKQLAKERGVCVLYMGKGQMMSEIPREAWNKNRETVTETLNNKENSSKFDDKLILSFLHPGEKTDINDINELSAVVKVELGGVSFLFTGDLGSDGERELLAGGADVSADVLKVGHHGSRYSSTADFLSAVSPEVAVISAGEENSYGHPHAEAVDRINDAGADVYCTINTGAICMRLSDGHVVTEIYRTTDR